MSESKLSKYLQKSVVNVPAGPRLRTPVILFDSKGFSLRNQITHPFDNNIVWWCKKGAKIEGSLAWLKRNIDRNLTKSRRYSPLCLAGHLQPDIKRQRQIYFIKFTKQRNNRSYY